MAGVPYGMMDLVLMPRPPRIRIIRQSCTGHRQLPGPVRGRAVQILYFDDVPGPDMLTSEQVLEQAKAFARAEREKD